MKHDISSTTVIIFYVVVVLLIAYDIYAVRNGTPGSSISAVMYSQAQKHPILSFIIGVLVGHLYWPNR